MGVLATKSTKTPPTTSCHGMKKHKHPNLIRTKRYNRWIAVVLCFFFDHIAASSSNFMIMYLNFLYTTVNFSFLSLWSLRVLLILKTNIHKILIHNCSMYKIQRLWFKNLFCLVYLKKIKLCPFFKTNYKRTDAKPRMLFPYF
jgi:hypothetical protein